MKAIGIKMVELIAMCAGEAQYRGYKTNGKEGNDPGYEVTYPDGYKSWCPKEVADKAYFKLDENNNGSIILKEDVENFITNILHSIFFSKFLRIILRRNTSRIIN